MTVRHQTAAEAARRKRERERDDGDRPALHNGPKLVTLPRVSIIATKPGEPSPGGMRWRMQ